jgi:MFS family permease
MTNAPRAAGAALTTSAGIAGLLAATCLPNVLVNVNSSAISVLIPAISDDTGASIQSLQWTVSGYSLVSAASIVAAGAMADRIGRRKVFLAGLFIFALCSSGVAISSTGLGVIVTRSLQGLASAIVVSGSLVLLSVTLPKERRLFGTTMWAASAGIGYAIGPLAGGVLAAWAGWGTIFWVSAAGMLLCVPLVLHYVTESKAATPANAAFDWWGVALIATAMSATIVYATYGPEFGWLSWTGVSLLALIAVSIAGFVALERRVVNPLVDLGLLRNTLFVCSTVALIVFTCAFTAFVLAVQLYLQQPFGNGLSALEAGVALLPTVIVMLLASIVVTRITKRVGMRTTIAGGFILMALGFLALVPIQPSWTIAYFLPCLVLVGLGGALANGPITAVATGSVDQEQAGAASGVNNMARYLGTAIGAPIATGIYIGVADSDLTDTLTQMGAKDPSDSAAKLVGASSTDALDALNSLPQKTADAVQSGVADALSKGIADLSIVLVLLTGVAIFIALAAGRIRKTPEQEEFDEATAPAAVFHTVPRTEDLGARR